MELYLDPSITKWLYVHNSPNFIYKKIWQYAPHSVIPEIPNLLIELNKEIKERYYKKVLLTYHPWYLITPGGNHLLPERPLDALAFSYTCATRIYRLQMLYKYFGSYDSIILKIKNMESDHSFKKKMLDICVRNEKLFTVGSYVKFRHNLRLEGLL